MDINHGAAVDPPDDDVFGPVEDGEEVFEWIDDQDGADEAGDPAGERPALTFRERLAAARAGVRRLRHHRREIAVATAVLVLACGAGGGATAWFDGVAGAADRADVVSLAVDSVVDGDPAAASYSSRDTSAVGQYVVELANNSPDAVTVDSVSVDAGTLMVSTGWKAVGPTARIPAGGTGKVALTMKLFCPWVLLGQQTGAFTAAPGTGGGASLSFPAVHVRVRDAGGDAHEMLLPTRVLVSAQLAEGQQTFRGPGGESVPEIVSADAGACQQYSVDRTTRPTGGTAARYPGTVAFAYDKVLSVADKSFVLGFTVKNTSDHAETVTTRTSPVPMDDNWLRTVWGPQRLALAPGQSAPAQLTVHILGCTSILTGAPVLGETMLEVDDTVDGSAQPVFIDQALTGSLRLAGDLVQREKAACG